MDERCRVRPLQPWARCPAVPWRFVARFQLGRCAGHGLAHAAPNLLTQHTGLSRREAKSTWVEWVDALEELRHDYALCRRDGARGSPATRGDGAC
jgi:hypothetical protein